MSRKSLILLTLSLVLFISFATGISAKGQENRIPDLDNEYYKSVESEYVESVREILDSRGFSNAGISLTKVLHDNGHLEYTISIHHRRIDRMDECRRAELSDIIEQAELPVRMSSITINYIEYM